MQLESVNLLSRSLGVRLIYFTPVHRLVPVQSGAECPQDREVSHPPDQTQKMVGSKPARISEPEGAQEQSSYG